MFVIVTIFMLMEKFIFSQSMNKGTELYHKQIKKLKSSHNRFTEQQ